MKKRALVIIGIAAAAVAILVLYLIYINVFVNKHRFDLTHAVSGGSEYRSIAAEYSIMPSYMWSRISNILLEDEFIMSDHLLEGRLAYQDAEPSGKYLLKDQSLLLLKYIASGERSEAVRLVKRINRDMRNGDGSYRGTFFKDGTEDKTYSNSDELMFLKAYTEYYSAYGGSDDLDNIKALIGIVFDAQGEIRPEHLQSVTYDSTEENLEQEGSPFEFTGVKISDIDLELISNLEKNSLLPAGSYDKALKIVQDALVSTERPYYAYAYTVTDAGEIIYIYSGGGAGAVSVSESLKTMVNLAGAGKLPDPVYHQFKANLINDGILYEYYYLTTGVSGGVELFGSYCDALILARYKEDKDLYRTICAMIAPRVATNKQSKALYLIFRDENNRFRFYGEENLKIFLIINGMFSV